MAYKKTIKFLLLIAAMIMLIYSLPLAVAKFAGTHTWEFNASSGVRALNCIKCHSYVLSELTTDWRAAMVYEKHRNAAGNSSYTQAWLNLTIDNQSSYGVCQLCHLAQLSDNNVHTKVTVRVCTDLDCHGDNATSNNTAYPDAGFMGPKLGYGNNSNPSNVHMRAFNQLMGRNGPYLNETGSNYKEGFMFCIGCHSHVGFTILYNGTESYAHDNFSAPKRRYL